jgi:hypothetical protein
VLDAATTITCGANIDEAHAVNVTRIKKQHALHERFSAKRWAERVKDPSMETDTVPEEEDESETYMSLQAKERRATIAASVRVQKFSTMRPDEVRAAMMSMRGGVEAEEAALEELLEEEYEQKVGRMRLLVQRWLKQVDKLQKLDKCVGSLRDASGVCSSYVSMLFVHE